MSCKYFFDKGILEEEKVSSFGFCQGVGTLFSWEAQTPLMQCAVTKVRCSRKLPKRTVWSNNKILKAVGSAKIPQETPGKAAESSWTADTAPSEAERQGQKCFFFQIPFLGVQSAKDAQKTSLLSQFWKLQPAWLACKVLDLQKGWFFFLRQPGHSERRHLGFLMKRLLGRKWSITRLVRGNTVKNTHKKEGGQKCFQASLLKTPWK